MAFSLPLPIRRHNNAVLKTSRSGDVVTRHMKVLAGLVKSIPAAIDLLTEPLPCAITGTVVRPPMCVVTCPRCRLGYASVVQSSNDRLDCPKDGIACSMAMLHCTLRPFDPIPNAKQSSAVLLEACSNHCIMMQCRVRNIECAASVR
jgi:hypothetical protein